jgi:hypothetical protein
MGHMGEAGLAGTDLHENNAWAMRDVDVLHVGLDACLMSPVVMAETYWQTSPDGTVLRHRTMHAWESLLLNTGRELAGCTKISDNKAIITSVATYQCLNGPCLAHSPAFKDDDH